ncbi:MAG TPA: hypothetical protein VK164_05965 [Flavobacterium sp.]|uniref:hypothetical protein n=1 Tax=Flavobacterium sp. TaxID=239 RepID=UPI002B4B3E7A|nr:hypothetical protein [Flavobacterium sp.]HLO73463.1 hypothetical protein [Flavobacterium sp.]
MIEKILKKINKLLGSLLKRPIRSLVLFGVLFRAFFFLFFYTSITIFPDSDGYIELANFVSSFNLKGYHGLRSLGYPIVISFFNQNLYLVLLSQFIIGVISMILWFKILLNFKFSLKSSFIITIFLSSFINIFFYETCILVESLVLFMMSVLFYLISIKILDRLNIVSLIGLSLFFSYLVLIKPFYAFLPFLFLLFLFLKKPKLKTILSQNLILIVFSLFAYYGWCYVNKVNTGYFAATSYYGLTNAQNCVYFAEKTPEEFDWISKPYVQYREKAIKENKDVAMSIWFAYEDGAYDKYNLTFQEFSIELGKFAKVAIKENPLDYAKQVIFRSWFNFWKPTIKFNDSKFNFKYGNKLCMGIWYIQYAILTFFRLLFVISIPYYLYLFFKTKDLSNEVISVVIVFSNSILQALVTFGTNDRYSFPFEFIMIIVVLLFLKDKIKLKRNKIGLV